MCIFTKMLVNFVSEAATAVVENWLCQQEFAGSKQPASTAAGASADFFNRGFGAGGRFEGWSQHGIGDRDLSEGS